MNLNTECVAMLLAGGQGSRLGVLTYDMAKPAVPYGGKYRIIDFPLSNCINSGIDTVGVLTQYQPLALNEYIGAGEPWDLDRGYKGVHVLPPYQQMTGTAWYKGTANAIYQNISFVDRYNPEYVLVLSGDHIYKMDYSVLLEHHKKQNADCTIAVLEVPMEEASRFGILNTDENGVIYEFEEKPKNPKSNKASMGIYIFTWSQLKKYLIEDNEDENSDNDFGKNIIPKMLNDGCKMVTHAFDGYWKDVGTIDSLWEANLDLLNPKVNLQLDTPDWKIYSRNIGSPPHYVGENAQIENSIVSEGCEVDGFVDYSVIFRNVTIEKDAKVIDSIIMPGAVIKSGAVVEYAMIAENCIIGENAHVGQKPEDTDDLSKWGVAVVGHSVNVKAGDVVKAGEMTGGVAK
ncbi:MAG: glucose-1-phosphate adenylyltransferase [Acutalibacteraceae bacterium]|nr:glucose-1-phosphate adenylyltransferase [Acutalibacteraceae bacterium]